MTPTEVPPVDVYAGDTLVFPTYTFQVDGEPQDMSDWSWSASWRPTRRSRTATPLTVDVTDAAEGRITITATAAQTAAMGSGGVWDLQGIRGEEVRTWLTGTTTYLEDVTRD